MRIRICLKSELAYNRDVADGTWLTLPMNKDELERAVQRIVAVDEKYLIVDFDTPFMIERNDDVFAINDVASVLSHYDDRLVSALCGCTDNVERLYAS